MTNEPDVSIIIPCFNGERYIRDALRSAVAQNGVDLEVIVVDDGSTDGSAAIVETEFPSVRLIRTENGGASRARNAATRLATGRFLQYLDADDLLAPHKLQRQVRALEMSGASVAYGDWKRLTSCEDGSFMQGEVVARRMTNPELELFADFWCPPAAYLFRRTIVEQTGGWNERLPVIQDARFALDCALWGGTFTYCPGVVAYYRVHGLDSLSRRDRRAFIRDCLTNAEEIEQWWEKHGCMSNTRKLALVAAYAHVARASFGEDDETFERAYSALLRLNPRYIPPGPAHLRAASVLLGYRRAENLALWYRRIKNTSALLRLPRRRDPTVGSRG